MLLPMLVIYQEYVRNHHFSLQVLAECKQKEKFNSILKRLEEKAVLQQRSLEIFLTYPMHQVRPAYALRRAISRGLVINEFPNLRIIYLFSFRLPTRYRDISSLSTNCSPILRTTTSNASHWSKPKANWRNCQG